MTRPTPRQIPNQNPHPRRGLLATLALLAIGAVVVYMVLPRGAKDAVNELASRSGVAGRVVPWADRAETAVRQMLDGGSGATAARMIQQIAHSLGDTPSLRTYSVQRMGDRISVRIFVSWKGPFNAHETEVVWEFSESAHAYAKIVSDTYGFITDRDNRRIDDWFRTEFYPALHSNTGG